MTDREQLPSRLRWQCRRGMRELDLLLANWLETSYATASEPQKLAFRELLSLADPELNAYLLGGQNPGDPQLARLIRDIRNRSRP